MPEINILSPHLADMIAAGEVVERPASVIKELMENSFDAGAKSVTVEINGGGSTFIRVRDNGCGMSPEDAGIAFMRHATSKLHDEHGLEAIGTMGFRGEALAAISAVSEVELTTRRRGDDAGTFVTLSAGDIQDMGSVGCPDGTVMEVRNLFFNTPARLKFLKSDRSEASACVQTALRCALGRPEISVRFIRDGREEFFSPGDGRADSCLYSLLGRELAKDMLPCTWDDAGLSLRGFVSSPAAARGNRAAQYFYCNGRYIRSALLQSAVEQAFRNSLLSNRYPACVMYIDMSTAAVDVNVHPAKTEVKFSEEKRVFDMVYHAVLAALTGEDRTAPSAHERTQSNKAAAVPVSAPAPAAAKMTGGAAGVSSRPAPRDDFYKTMSAKDYRESLSHGKSAADTPANPLCGSVVSLRSDAPAYQPRLNMGEDVTICNNLPSDGGNDSSKVEKLSNNVENPVQNVENSIVPDHKIVGEAFRTYIIVELGDELILIDKHAAHERMIFDTLKARDNSVMSQTLLTPVTLRLSPSDAELLEANAALISAIGYELDEFGESEYILRAVPADMTPSDAAASVEEILGKLRRGKAPDAQSMRDELLHTVACKAAIKAGWDSDRRELQILVDKVLLGEIKYCPHGRPVSTVITKKELEKMFKRSL